MTAVLLLLVPLVNPVADPPSETTLAAWVADLASDDGAKQRAAHDALVKAGPKAKAAVPELVKLLDPKSRAVALATNVLGAIGPDAKDAVPALMKLIPKEPGGFGYFAEQVAFALARIDGPKIEATRVLMFASTKGHSVYLTVSQTFQQYPAEVTKQLILLCADPDPKARAKAAEVIGTLKQRPAAKVPPPSLYDRAGDAAKGIAPALEKLLSDGDDTVRLSAARAVTHVAPEHTDAALATTIALMLKTVHTKKPVDGYDVFQPVPEKAAKVLVPLFEHDSANVRMWAVNHLVALREHARGPVEGVLKASKSARARAAAAQTLGGMYGDGRPSIPVLSGALADGEFAVRFAAALALVQVGERGSDAQTAAVPVLVEALQHKDAAVRLEASQYLRMTGPAAKLAVPALTKLLDDTSPEVKLEAALALVGVDAAHGPAAVPALTQGLKLNEALAARAAKALADIGPPAKAALPDLLAKFDAKNAHLRLYAAEAAARIDPAHAPKAVEVLVALLKDKKHQSSMVRSYGLAALKHIGPSAKPALPALTDLLKDDGPFHFDVAAAMLAIDPESKPAVEWLRTVLRVLSGGPNPDYEDADEVLERVPELGAAAAPLVPALAPLLKSKVLRQRRWAIEALGAIGPASKMTLPDLKALAASDSREDVRKLAAAAVAKIEK